MITNSTHIRIPQAQQGAALAVSLIMLLILTLLGVTAMQTTIFEERMAGNARDANTAFQAAEAGLRAGETYLNLTASIGPFDGSSGLYDQDTAPAPSNLESDSSWPATAVIYSGSLSEVAAAPEYIIEHMRPVLDPDKSLAADEPLADSGIYRITARATGNTDTAVAVLQSTFKR